MSGLTGSIGYAKGRDRLPGGMISDASQRFNSRTRRRICGYDASSSLPNVSKWGEYAKALSELEICQKRRGKAAAILFDDKSIIPLFEERCLIG